MSTNGSLIWFLNISCAIGCWGVWRKGKEAIKAHTNLSLGRSGSSIVNTEDEAFGAAALNHSLKGE